MGVKIQILGNQINTGVGAEEWEASEYLKLVFEKEFENKDVNGTILIKPNFKALGQGTEDIDIVVWMRFEDYKYKVFSGYKTNNDGRTETIKEKTKKEIKFSSLLLTIEHKSHDNTGIELSNTDLKVKYRGKLSSAIDQSIKQKYALVNFIKRNDQLLENVNPHVNNLVWLPNTSITKPWGCQLNNVIFGGFNFKKLMETAFEHVPPYKPPNSNKHYQRSFIDTNISQPDERIENILLNYDRKIKFKQGDLSRRKLEQVVQKQLEGENLSIFDHIGTRTTIIKGVPGSGKTINLLHFAYHLAANKGERCLILTYNKALIADIDRLAVLAGFKDDPSSATVGSNTCMRLMRALLIAWGIYEEEPANLTSVEKRGYFKTHFFDKYELLLSELLEYLKISDEEDIKLIKDTLYELNWKTILIDESQDWYPGEKDILYYLFGAENCVIAYGSHQLIRNETALNWYDGAIKPQLLNLKVSYRQKNNLCHFIKDISSHLELKDEIVINKKLTGGTVNVYTRSLTQQDYNYHFEYCVKTCKNAGYDILLLVNNNDTLPDLLKSNNTFIHDGTIEKYKIRKPENMDACRVFNYQSCRGLEGWLVIANNLDLFLEQVSNNTTEAISGLSLTETKRKSVAQWLYMILSRPIDRLVISLNNTQSEYSQLILRTAQAKPDYCEIIQ